MLDRLASRDGVPVPVGQVARAIRTTGAPTLWRKNREVGVTALADVVDDVQPPDVSQALWGKLAPLRASLPRCSACRPVAVRFAGER